MSEEQKSIIDIAARLMIAKVGTGCTTADVAYANQCLNLARVIVNGTMQGPKR